MQLRHNGRWLALCRFLACEDTIKHVDVQTYSKHLHVAHLLITKAQRAPWFPPITPKKTLSKVWPAQMCFVNGCTGVTIYRSVGGFKSHLIVKHGFDKKESERAANSAYVMQTADEKRNADALVVKIIKEWQPTTCPIKDCITVRLFTTRLGLKGHLVTAHKMSNDELPRTLDKGFARHEIVSKSKRKIWQPTACPVKDCTVETLY